MLTRKLVLLMFCFGAVDEKGPPTNYVNIDTMK
jgi:hypothetical protein